MLRYLINFVYPPRCAACGRRQPLESSRRVCAECIGRIERLPEPVCAVCGIPLKSTAHEGDWCVTCAASPPHFSKARAVARYSPRGDDDDQVVPSIIRRHKYGLDQSLAHALAECLANPLPLAGGDYDIVVPVPLHHARLRWRGFNQAAMLGAAVAERLALPLDVATLVRTRATTPQTAQDHRERGLNVHGAFAVRRAPRVAGRRILLVDDVMTTGATADECARTLLEAGARRVDVLTLARAV
jgi:ComF family protein